MSLSIFYLYVYETLSHLHVNGDNLNSLSPGKLSRSLDSDQDGLIGITTLNILSLFGDSDMDFDGIWDSVDDCVGAYDECGVCNGPDRRFQSLKASQPCTIRLMRSKLMNGLSSNKALTQHFSSYAFMCLAVLIPVH